MEDLILAGDHTSWSIDDWNWDHLTFAATPAASVEGSSGRLCGTSKRMRSRDESQLQDILCQAGSSNSCQALAPGDVCESTEPLRLPLAPGHEQSFSSATTSTVVATEATNAGEGGSGVRRSSSLCQVEGCGRSLRSLSIYHQRCHICEVHIKMPKFEREGKLQRFCQRCGRCHELHAFDKDRRSCRAQLARHNARRRRRADQSGEEKQPSPPPSMCQAASIPLAFDLDYPAAQQPVATLGSAPALANLTHLPQTAHTALAGLPYAAVSQQPISRYSVPSSAPYPAAVLGVATDPSPVDPSKGQVSSFDAALQLMGHSLPGQLSAVAPASAAYQPATFVSRLSVKLFNCTPHDLPLDLRDQLTTWLHSTPAGAEGYIRAGCVHVTLDILADHDQKANMQQLLQHVAQQSGNYLGGRTALLQLGQDMALVRGNKVLRSWTASFPPSGSSAASWQIGHDTVSSAQALCLQLPEPQQRQQQQQQQQRNGLLPIILDIQPAVVVCTSGSSSGPWVHLTGMGLRCEDCQVVCRGSGQHLRVSPETHAACCASGSEDSAGVQTLSVQLPNSTAPGIVWLEVQRGALLSPACPLIVLPDAQLAAETQQVLAALIAAPSAALGSGTCGQHAALVDMGFVLRAHFSEQGAAGLPPGLLAAAAARLLPHVCRMGAAQLSVVLLDVVEACSGDAVELLLCAPDSLSPLHHAVASGSQATMLAIIHWAEQNATPLQASMAGQQGLTPLHLAAMLPDSGAIARLLNASTHEPAASWFCMLTHDGCSPHDFAARVGDSTAADACFAEQVRKETSQDPLQEQGSSAAADCSSAVSLQPATSDNAVSLLCTITDNTEGMAEQKGMSAAATSEQQEAKTWLGVLPAAWASSTSTSLERPHAAGDQAASWDEEAVALIPVHGHVPSHRACSWHSPALLSLWPLGQRPTVATLGVVSCLCTCVVLLRGWTG